MGSPNLTKPDEIPETTLDSESKESENNSEKDYEQFGTDQSLCQQMQAPTRSGYTVFKCCHYWNITQSQST
jgi:hypothetical protein